MLQRLNQVTLLIMAALLCATAVRAQENARPPMPTMNVKLNATAYPSIAIKQGEQGRVLVQFTINKRGRIDNQIVLQSEPAEVFNAAALAVLRDIKFTLPDDWADTGGPEQRYRLSVLFKLNPCVPDACTPPKAHPEADDFLIIGALRN